MVLRTVAADSSSVILLQKVRLLESFLLNYRLVIPGQVYDELTGFAKKGSTELGTLLQDNIVHVPDSSCLEGMGQGEGAVIALYFGTTADFVLLDDKKGARYCRSQSIPFINALLVPRILHLAAAINEERCRESTELLAQQGYYSDTIIEKAGTMQDVDLHRFMP